MEEMQQHCLIENCMARSKIWLMRPAENWKEKVWSKLIQFLTRIRLGYFIKHLWNTLWCLKMNLLQEAKKLRLKKNGFVVNKQHDRNYKENAFGDWLQLPPPSDVLMVLWTFQSIVHTVETQWLPQLSIQTFCLNGTNS